MKQWIPAFAGMTEKVAHRVKLNNKNIICKFCAGTEPKPVRIYRENSGQASLFIFPNNLLFQCLQTSIRKHKSFLAFICTLSTA
jgi:hypothetical protein